MEYFQCLNFVARIVVFDSGLGSLSIINPILKNCGKVEIIYFADSKIFLMGKNLRLNLEQIIKKQ